EPDAPAVAIDDALHRGEANARAGEFVHAMQALEGAEQLVGVLHIEAGAIVAHEVHLPRAVFHDAYDDAWILLFRRELPRVAEQVFEYDAHELRIGRGLHALPHRDVRVVAKVARLQFLDDFTRH